MVFSVLPCIENTRIHANQHYNDLSIWHRFSRNNVNECCFGDSFRSELLSDIDAIFTFKQTNPFDITPQIEIHIYTSFISWIWFLQKFWTTSIFQSNLKQILSIKKKKNILGNTIIVDLIFFTIYCKYPCWWYLTHWRLSDFIFIDWFASNI